MGVEIVYYGDSIDSDVTRKNGIGLQRHGADGQEITAEIQAIAGGKYLYKCGNNSEELSDDEVIEKLKETRLID